jgi:hypothetical protein
MKLEDQIYQIKNWNKVEHISHTELLWNNKQIIRFQEEIYNRSNIILSDWNEISLYNHYNPINIDLIRNYKENKAEYDWAMIAKIIWIQNDQPILDWKSFQEVKVLKMENIDFEDIKNEDLYKSIMVWNNITVENLIEWLSKEFYKWSYLVKDIIELQKLFFRQIKLK